MSLELIKDITESISVTIEEAREGDISNSDPEIWEQLFCDYISEDLRKLKVSKTQEETDGYRAMYAQFKIVVDEALLPSELCEAQHILMGDITDALVVIAKKDKIVGAEILRDMRTVYMKDDFWLASDFGKAVARKIARILAAPTPQAATFNIAAVGEDASQISGKSVVFTGTLTTMTRQQAGEIAEKLGAHVSGTVSKNTDFLVIGADAGSKVQKAAALGVTVITEEKWNEMTGMKPAGNKPGAGAAPSV